MGTFTTAGPAGTDKNPVVGATVRLVVDEPVAFRGVVPTYTAGILSGSGTFAWVPFSASVDASVIRDVVLEIPSRRRRSSACASARSPASSATGRQPARARYPSSPTTRTDNACRIDDSNWPRASRSRSRYIVAPAIVVTSSSGDVDPAHKVRYERLSSGATRFSNYDGSTRTRRAADRDWPIDFIFYRGASISKVKDLMRTSSSWSRAARCTRGTVTSMARRAASTATAA